MIIVMEVRISPQMSVMDKLKILSDAAKYDVSCSSSGSSRANDGTGLGNTVAAGLCHSFAADGRCPMMCLGLLLPQMKYVN